jgi:hypothetical protein
MKNNMPIQPVQDLKIHPRENDLIVATHGRGIWIADISPLAELCSKVLDQDIYLFNIEPKIKWVNNDFSNSSSANFAGESESNDVAVYYYLKNKAATDVKVSVFQGGMLINEIKGSKDAGINKVLWNMSIPKERSEAEKKRMKARLKRFADMGFSPRGRQSDANFEFTPALEGTYTIILTIGDKKLKRKATILIDNWY